MNNEIGMFAGDETTVTIELEDGGTLECVVLCIFEVGPEALEYIAVMPETADEEDGEVYFYRYSESSSGEPELENIETDEEYEMVADAYDEVLDEQEYMEMMSGEDRYDED